MSDKLKLISDPKGDYLCVDDVEAALKWCLVDLYEQSTHDKIRELLRQIENRDSNERFRKRLYTCRI